MINSTIAKKTYTGNAGVLVYPIGFQYVRDTLTNAPEIEVLLDGGELEFGTDYTVSDDGLNVILSNAVANGAKIEIYRATSMLQESDYQVGRISPEQIEKDFDRLAMVDQELAQTDEDIAMEVALAKGRILAIEGDIDLLEDKDSELEGAISEEADTRAHDDGILLEKIEQLNTRNEDYREEAANAIAAEATARSTAVTSLGEAITEEIAERRTVDTHLTNLISDTNNTVASVLGMVRDVDAKVDTKQDKLVAGANIKIEGNVISAEGGSGGSGGIKQYTSMPVAADVTGEVAQYIGADGDYKHGYFYESVEQATSNSYSDYWTQRGEMAITDVDVFFDFLNKCIERAGNRTLAVGDSVKYYYAMSDTEQAFTSFYVETTRGGITYHSDIDFEWVMGEYPDANIGIEMLGYSEDSCTFTVTGIAGTEYIWQELDLAGEALKNLATGNQSLTVLGTSAADNFSVNVGTGSSTSGTRAVAVGNVTSAKGNQAVAVGFGATSSATQATSIGGSAQATSSSAVAVGYNAKATATNAVQLGVGTNSSSNTLQYMSYTVIDNKGKVPLARLDGVAKQFTTMPSASAYVGGIVQYIGEDGNYKKGSFYKCASETNIVYSAGGYTIGGPAITINFDEAKFLAQNPVWADHGVPTWRADGGVNGWNVWTQTPSLTISNADLRDVWGVEVLGDGEPIAVDGASIQITQQEEVTYYWVEVEFGGGAEFPDQTDNAGKFLQTNGSEVSWGSALVNEASGADTNLSITGGKTPLTDSYGKGTNVGISSKATGSSTAFGYSANASGTYSVAVGYGARTANGYAVSIGFSSGRGGGSSSIAIGGYAGEYSGSRSISLGHNATAKGDSSVLINTAGTEKSSTTPNVFQWANPNGLYTLFDSDGNVPVERLSNIIDQDPNEANGSYILNIGDRMVMMGGVVDIEDIQQGAIAEDVQIEYPTSLGDSTHIFPSVTIISSDSHGLTSWVSDRREDRIDVCVRNDGDQPATGVKIAWQVVGMKSV